MARVSSYFLKEKGGGVDFAQRESDSGKNLVGGYS